MEGRWDCQFYLPSHYELEKSIRQSGHVVSKLGDPFVSMNIVDGPFGSDLKSDEYTATGIPLIRVSNCRTGDIIHDDDLVFISNEKHRELIRSEVLPGDVLLTKAGHILGYSAVFPAELKRGNITSHLASIRPSTNILPDFLALYLSSNIGIKQIYRWGNKATRPELNTDEVRKLLVVVPSLTVQRKLVTVLRTAREERNAKLKAADELLSSLDGYVLDALGLTLPAEDTRKAFAVRSASLKGSRLDPPSYQPFFAKGYKPKAPLHALVAVADIDSHTSDKPKSDGELVPYVGLPECEQTEVREVVMRPYSEVKGRSIVRPGDILFARIEPSVFNKKYVLVEDLKGYPYAYTSTEFYVVTPRHDAVMTDYLYAMFFCSFVFNQTKGKTTGSSGRRRLDPALFRTLHIPLPDKSLQQTIATEVRRRREEARRLRSEAEAGWAEAKKRFEEALLGGSSCGSVAFSDPACQNRNYDEGTASKDKARHRPVAKGARRSGRGSGGVSGKGVGLGGPVDGVRERAGEYGAPEGASGAGEGGSTRPLDSTRYFETAKGTLSYTEVAGRLAVSASLLLQSIIYKSPTEIILTSEWLCGLHRSLAGELFPEWAGKFRNMNLQVGSHTPPPFYEVPVLVRQFCDDLVARITGAAQKFDPLTYAETLAFADWRFQWIHPFRDFNGRVGRIILTAVLHLLNLPPAETAAVEPEARERYLAALRAADKGDLSTLTDIWTERLERAVEDSEKE